MYPDNLLQSLLGSWWQEDKGKDIKRGRLIKAYVPHVDQIPNELNPIGRTQATNHQSATYEILPLRVGQQNKSTVLPVAALPANPGERHAVYRVKKRPLLIINEGYFIQEELRRGRPKWQTSPTMLAAPFYGVKNNTQRAGFNPQFVERVQKCEYPHYIWDILPIDGGEESLLRLDHLQPIGRHHESIEISDYCLTDDALLILDDWLDWFLQGELETSTILADIRSSLIQL